MELIIGIAIIAGLGYLLWKANAKPESLDINKDGKVDVKDAVAAAVKVEEVVVEEVKTVAKKTAAGAKKAGAAVKKATAKKAPAKKTTKKVIKK